MPNTFTTLQGGLKIRADRAAFSFSTLGCRIELHAWSIHGQGNQVLSIAEPLVFKEGEDGRHHPPFLKLEVDQAQELMDSLWECGLRPSEGTGSAGSLAATQAHLKDMQTIVMHKLGIVKR